MEIINSPRPLFRNEFCNLVVFEIFCREIAEDGKELLFDHGAPFFSISNTDVLRLVHEWELKGLVAEWKENFGSFDYHSKKFIEIDQVYD